MNIIFHEKFYETYDSDPAAAPGRMEPIMRELKKYPHYKFIAPLPAEPKDILRAHSARHIENIKRDDIVYTMAHFFWYQCFFRLNKCMIAIPPFW